MTEKLYCPSKKKLQQSYMKDRDILNDQSLKKGFKHLILVTDAFHTRRAYHAFQKIFSGSEVRLEISAARNDIFNESNWWTSDKGISAYVLESIKYPVYLLSSKNATFIRND